MLRTAQGTHELDQSFVSWSARKLFRDNNQDPATHSEEWQQDDNQFGRRRMEFHNMQISDHRYLEKVFKNLRNLEEEAPVLDLKTNFLIWGLCRQRRKPLFILDQITMKIWKYTGRPTSKSSRICSISTQRLILEHEAAILDGSTIDWKASSRDLRSCTVK